MPRCAFLTLGEITADDSLMLAPMAALGWQVDKAAWHEDHDWRSFDRVVIRSPWDYQRHAAEFVRVLEEITAQGVPLDNALSLVRWNLRKTYLRDLGRRGVATVPTEWRDALEPGALTHLLRRGDGAEFVVKPVISASAERTWRITATTPGETLKNIEQAFRSDAVMIQPIVRSVLTEGEFSLLYFNGLFSHAVLKSAARGDFRVQKEFGGSMAAVRAGDDLREAAQAVLEALPETPLYARVDLVRADHGAGYWLMEVELIEPSLCLGFDAGAAARFAAAIAAAQNNCRPLA